MLAAGRIALPRTAKSSAIMIPQHKGIFKLPSLRQFRHNVGMRCSAAQQKKLAKRMEIVATYPEPETEKERSPIDFPQVSLVQSFAIILAAGTDPRSAVFRKSTLIPFGSSPRTILASIVTLIFTKTFSIL